MGIEPTRPAWKAGILPLNYTRVCMLVNRPYIIAQFISLVKGFFEKSPKNLLTLFLKFYKIRTVQLRDTTNKAISTRLLVLVSEFRSLTI